MIKKMTERMHWIALIVLIGGTVVVVECRDAEAKCRRNPNSKACRQTTFTPKPGRPTFTPTNPGSSAPGLSTPYPRQTQTSPNPTTQATPMSSAPNVAADNRKDPYCAQWKDHYAFYCLGNGRGNPKADEFCPAFHRDCDPKDAMGKYMPGSRTSPCDDHKNQYTNVCVQNRPTTAQATQFCQTYANVCANPGGSPQAQPTPIEPVVPPPLPQQPVVPPQLPPAVPQQPVMPPQLPPAVPQQPVLPPQLPPAVPQQPAGAPLTVGQSTGVGGIANVGSQTAVNPFSGVNTGRTVGAGPIGVSSGSSVGFGGLPGLSSLGSSPLGSMFGRRRRRWALMNQFLLKYGMFRV